MTYWAEHCWDENGTETIGLPDYLNDLNAMHEAEKVLRPTQVKRFLSELWPIMAASKEAELGTFHATAAQRAEAFLKILNIWKP